MKSEKYAQYYSTWSINAVNVGGPNGLVLKKIIRVNKQTTTKQDTSTVKKQNKTKTFPYFQFSFLSSQLFVINYRLKMLNENFQNL